MQEHAQSLNDASAPETFAKYLKQERKGRKLTQDLLAQHLSAHSRVLSGIDAVTISRWERSMTEPTLERQRHVISFFGGNPDHYLPFRESRRRSGPRSDCLSYIVRHFMSSPRIGAKVGSFPELRSANYTIEPLPGHAEEESFLHLILEYQQSIHYCASSSMSLEQLKGLLAAHRGFSVVCTRYHHYVGHAVGFSVKPEVFDDLIHARMKESELEPRHLARHGEPFCFYLYSTYGGTKLAAANLLLKLVRNLPRSGDNLKMIGGTSLTSDGARLMKAVHFKPVLAGHEVQENGVRYQGRDVAFLTYAVDARTLRQERDIGYLLQQ
ncbi:helix-turn-helix domain-containing protein [Endozoicomonadaceae bacterium StTr2]